MLKRKREDAAPDLPTQLEDLLDQVWRSESDADFWDRMDALDRQERARRPQPKDRKVNGG